MFYFRDSVDARYDFLYDTFTIRRECSRNRQASSGLGDPAIVVVLDTVCDLITLLGTSLISVGAMVLMMVPPSTQLSVQVLCP